MFKQLALAIAGICLALPCAAEMLPQPNIMCQQYEQGAYNNTYDVLKMYYYGSMIRDRDTLIEKTVSFTAGPWDSFLKAGCYRGKPWITGEDLARGVAKTILDDAFGPASN